MKKFITEPDFWQLFPGARFGVVVARGIKPGDAVPESDRNAIAAVLAKANRDAEKFLTAPVLSQNEVVAVWREAYQKFKTKKGVRASIENLLKRVSKGIGVGSIEPLVDLYNSVSLTYGFPAGGEDIDTIAGDMRLTIASGDEEPTTTLPGEVAYLDDEGAVCRCWNWRDGQRTMLTEKTVNAFLIVECVDPSRHDDLVDATKMLTALVGEYLGGTTESAILTVDDPACIIEN